jgi:hypothetical protein
VVEAGCIVTFGTALLAVAKVRESMSAIRYRTVVDEPALAGAVLARTSPARAVTRIPARA